ncbi:hypothetical protein NL676_012836 [Syzygium grande]|nr:hypothetical protein NL676_012836 [Syzygium grande]
MCRVRLGPPRQKLKPIDVCSRRLRTLAFAAVLSHGFPRKKSAARPTKGGGRRRWAPRSGPGSAWRLASRGAREMAARKRLSKVSAAGGKAGKRTKSSERNPPRLLRGGMLLLPPAFIVLCGHARPSPARAASGPSTSPPPRPAGGPSLPSIREGVGGGPLVHPPRGPSSRAEPAFIAGPNPDICAAIGC